MSAMSAFVPISLCLSVRPMSVYDSLVHACLGSCVSLIIIACFCSAILLQTMLICVCLCDCPYVCVYAMLFCKCPLTTIVCRDGWSVRSCAFERSLWRLLTLTLSEPGLRSDFSFNLLMVSSFSTFCTWLRSHSEPAATIHHVSHCPLGFAYPTRFAKC